MLSVFGEDTSNVGEKYPDIEIKVQGTCDLLEGTAQNRRRWNWYLSVFVPDFRAAPVAASPLATKVTGV